MNTEPAELEEEYVPTRDVIADDGVVITPTSSRTKVGWFDHPVLRFLAVAVLLVGVGIGFTVAFNMGASQRQEVTSTEYNQAGMCLSVKSFQIKGNQSGENPVLFAKYQAAHPDETPQESKINRGCPIAFENNTNR